MTFNNVNKKGKNTLEKRSILIAWLRHLTALYFGGFFECLGQRSAAA